MVQLGRTGIVVNKDGFGALPIQRRSVDDALPILRKAFDSGINFFDTARGYTDSEEKLGKALHAQRGSIFIASKTHAKTGEAYLKDVEKSLGLLQSDYIDIYQFHNPEHFPKPGDGTGLYEAALQAKKEGKIRFIGISNHRLPVAVDALNSGLYDTLQFPFSYLSDDRERELPALCHKANVGFIAMKALSGGLITGIDAARTWMMQYENVVPIWGIQRESELDELIAAARENARELTDAQKERIAKDREELTGEFCRSCGYCLPCPAGIKISNCARMGLLLRRMPPDQFLTPEWQAEMEKIKDCRSCGGCESRCPYSLPVQKLLKKNYDDYRTFIV